MDRRRESRNSPHVRVSWYLTEVQKQFSEERLDLKQMVLEQLEIPKPDNKSTNEPYTTLPAVFRIDAKMFTHPSKPS